MDVPVAIAGAGPVGLSLALGLARYGVPSVVFEARLDVPNESRAPGILPRTLEVMRGWRALDALLAAGTRLDVLAPVVVGEAGPSVRIDLGELADVCATPFALILPQDRTEAVLADVVDDAGLAEVRRGEAVEGFDADDDGVTVRVAGRRIRAGFLVGCDGARSTVRNALGMELAGRTYPVRLGLADVRVDDDRDALPWPRVAPRSQGALAAVRLAPGLWRLIYTLDRDQALAERVAEVLGEGPFAEVWSSEFRIHRRVAPRFAVGRVCLAGDAAHLVSPAGGMGMNAGIQDASDLAWKLARALAGADTDLLLASYDAERRGAVTGVLGHTTDWLTRGGLLASAAVRRVTFGLAGAAFARPALRRAMLMRMAMLDVRYRSAIVGGHGIAGARAPNVAWGGGRVHDLVATRPMLFRFGGPDVPGVPSVEGDDALAAAWGARRGELVLLRPDGHVGYMGKDPRGVLRALGEPEGVRPLAPAHA